MCILFLYFCDKPNPDGYRLIMASNRDEFYFRPTADASFWAKNPNILAGKTHDTRLWFYIKFIKWFEPTPF